ncbi:MAG TPA: ABC transporter ATP-binding protein [Hyphomicrobiaceae bacterium]|nr:ABC transporter ATP-binding protein [Hyphomicrobiaceae bacterium]
MQIQAPSRSVVSVENLHVRFAMRDATVSAVNGVSFELEAGKVLGILGESGSGKSVTLRALMRMLPPARTRVEGRIRIAGHEITAMDEDALRKVRGAKVAMIFQEPMTALDPVFTVGVQIAETIVRHEGISYAAAWRRALELLEMVQIPSAARRLRAYPHEMSGGMRQRAMIALALSCRPSVLLADEPTTALDVTVQIQIILLLRQLQQDLGMAVVFVTHDVGVAVEVADRIGVMYAGRLVELGSTEEVIERPAHPYTAALLTSTVLGSAFGRRLDTIPGMPPDLRALPEGCSFAPRCQFCQDACRVSMPPEHAMAPGHTTRCLRIAAREIELAGPTLSARNTYVGGGDRP